MSQNLSGSGGSQVDQLDNGENPEYFYVYGMYFCGACENIMTPIKQLNEKLQFRCKVCENKKIDFSKIQGEQCIIYNKELKPGSKSSKADYQYAMDPTLPRVEFTCSQCGHETAVYIVTPDDFQSSIEVKMICDNPGRCFNTWTLPIGYRVQGNKIKQV